MDPIYDCLMCGETLPRHEQGRYVWCARCRTIWDKGFETGLAECRRMKELSSVDEIREAVDAVAPYTVKGYR